MAVSTSSLLALTLNKARHGGYYVTAYDIATDRNNAVVFAGSLDECLAYASEKLEPDARACDCGGKA